MNDAVHDLPPVSAEFDPLRNTTLDGDMNASRWANDHKLTIRFRRDVVLNPSKSTAEKRAIFDEVDFITIWTPGSQLTVVDAPVKSAFYMQRFGKQYREWLTNMEQSVGGTPLETFPFLFNKVGLVAEMKAMHILTVEQLAELPDGATQKIMGGYELRKRAQEWLAKSKIETEDTEKEAMRVRLAELEAQMAMLVGNSQPAPVEPKAKGK